MASIVHIPFNFAPVSIQSGSGTYTVPSGKYARVEISATAKAFLDSISFASNSVLFMSTSGGHAEKSIELWLKSGDVITTSASLASGSLQTVSSGGFDYDQDKFTTTLTILVNGVAFAKVSATLSAAVGVDTSADLTFPISGSTEYNYIASEYNNIS